MKNINTAAITGIVAKDPWFSVSAEGEEFCNFLLKQDIGPETFITIMINCKGPLAHQAYDELNVGNKVYVNGSIWSYKSNDQCRNSIRAYKYTKIDDMK